MGFGTYPDSTTLDGDNDTLLAKDASGAATVEVPAKHATGGMIAHGTVTPLSSGGTVDAYYSIYGASHAEGYYKIATLQYSPTVGSGEYVELYVMLGTFSYDKKAYMKIGLSNRGGVLKRVYEVGGQKGAISYIGIKTYIETDNTVSVYMYHITGAFSHMTVKLSTSAFHHGAIVVPPNSVSSITTPTGTLSLDTTTGKYANCVPDGNMDWITLTNAAGYTGTTRYRRHSNGLVEVQSSLSALGTTTDGTQIAMSALPPGYRPTTLDQSAVLTGSISGGSAARILIGTDGTIKIYNYATSTAGWRFSALFMAEA